MKIIEIDPTNAVYTNDVFHSLVIQADEPEEPEMLTDALGEYPDVTLAFSHFPMEDYELPNCHLIMFWARRDITGDIPALIASVEAEFKQA